MVTGKLLKFPEPVAGRVTTREEARADVSRERRGLVRIETDDIDIIDCIDSMERLMVGFAEWVCLTTWNIAISQDRMRNVRRLEGAQKLASCLTNAYFGAEMADDIDAFGHPSRCQVRVF